MREQNRTAAALLYLATNVHFVATISLFHICKSDRKEIYSDRINFVAIKIKCLLPPPPHSLFCLFVSFFLFLLAATNIFASAKEQIIRLSIHRWLLQLLPQLIRSVDFVAEKLPPGGYFAAGKKMDSKCAFAATR